jgi:hypothetical protein
VKFWRPAFFVACVTLLLNCASRLEGQTAHLILQGDPGEFISQGQSFDLIYTPANSAGFFSATVEQLTNGLPSSVDFVFGLFSPPHTTLDFATNQLGIPISPGFYPDAQRADFADPGHPGLDVTFDFRGSNTLTGDFTIQDAVFAPDPNSLNGFRVISFDATFNQRSDNETAVLHGSFSYSAVPEPSVFGLCGIAPIVFVVLGRGRVAKNRAGISF